MSGSDHERIGLDNGYITARRMYETTIASLTQSDFMVCQSSECLSSIEALDRANSSSLLPTSHMCYCALCARVWVCICLAFCFSSAARQRRQTRTNNNVAIHAE